MFGGRREYKIWPNLNLKCCEVFLKTSRTLWFPRRNRGAPHWISSHKEEIGQDEKKKERNCTKISGLRHYHSISRVEGIDCPGCSWRRPGIWLRPSGHGRKLGRGIIVLIFSTCDLHSQTWVCSLPMLVDTSLACLRISKTCIVLHCMCCSSRNSLLRGMTNPSKL